MKHVAAIRGAVQIKSDIRDEIISGVTELFHTIMDNNRLLPEDIISIIISQTEDLVSCNPAYALRKGTGVEDIPLFGVQECRIDNPYPRMIRFIIHVNLEEGQRVSHVYINGAEKLRPDLVSGK